MERPSRNPVRLVPFDPQWPAAFRQVADALQAALVPYAERIDHIGSTSIPGMLAKPVLDIDVTLHNVKDIDHATDILLRLGYEARGNRYDRGMWAFFLRDGKPAQRVYLCAPENLSHRNRIAFRDYLTAHADTAQSYATLKTRLAQAFEHDGDGYTAAKRSFIESIVRRAGQGSAVDEDDRR